MVNIPVLSPDAQASMTILNESSAMDPRSQESLDEQITSESSILFKENPGSPDSTLDMLMENPEQDPSHSTVAIVRDSSVSVTVTGSISAEN